MAKPVNVERIAKKIMSTELASRHSDPRFYSGLSVLPNPDPILRKSGYADDTFDAIEMDPHVMGELRSIRGGLLGYDWRVVDGEEGKATGKEKAAWELCEWWMEQAPAPNMTWEDTIWNIAKAVFHGMKVHELVWGKVDSWVLPEKVMDRPSRRFRFNIDNELRLLTKEEQVNGIEIEPYRYLLSRHMPSYENPYGKAIFSSCFWPYTFKHGGFKFFYKFCERYGLPWPIGRYPNGTQPKDQQELLDALLNLVEDGAAAIPDGDKVELLSVSHQGELAQEKLIHLCNREMSKCLTSQTLATEMRQVGSNAAAQTHMQRQGDNASSDRNIVCATINTAFRWITKFNFGDDVKAPYFEFYKKRDANKERADQWEIASRIGRPSRKAFHEEMHIPEAESDDDLLAAPKAPAPIPPASFSAHYCKHCGTTHEFAGSDEPELTDAAVDAADQAIEKHWLIPALKMLQQFEADGKTLADFQAALPLLYSQLDDAELLDITEQVVELAAAQGMEAVT